MSEKNTTVPTIDTNELERSADQSRKIWQQLGEDADRAGVQMARIWDVAVQRSDDFSASVTRQREVIRALESDVLTAGQAIDQLAAGSTKDILGGQLNTIRGELDAAREALTGGGSSMDVLVEGMQGVIGAFEAGSGALNLFGIESERLAGIQAKLQAVMSVLNGVQQVQNTLQQTNALRITVVSKITQLWSAAQNRLTAALGGSAVAANVLMGVLTLGLSVAITAVVAGISKLQERNRKLKEEQQAAAAAVKQRNESAASSVLSLLMDYKKLQAQWDSLEGDTKAQNKFIAENQQAFEDLGIAVNNVSDAENLFIGNEKAFIASIAARAMVAGAMEAAAEKYKAAIEKMIALDTLTQEADKPAEYKGDDYMGSYAKLEEQRKSILQFRKDVLESGVSEDLAAGDNLLAKAFEESKKRVADLFKNGLNSFTPPQKSTETPTGNSDQSIKLARQYEDDAAQARIDAMDDGLEKILAQNAENFRQQERQIREQYQSLSDNEIQFLVDAAKAKQNAADQNAKDAVLADMMTFAQKYEKIITDTNAKIKDAQLAGASLGQFGELADQEDEQLSQLAAEFAAKSADYEAFINSMVGASTEKINAEIAAARNLIGQIIEGGIDEEEVEKYLGYIARIDALQGQLQNNKPDVSPDKDAKKDWKELSSVLKKVSDEFGEIGDAIGGVAGEAIKAAGTVATSVVSMIDGIKSVSGAAAAQMNALEKASAILAIIGAAMQAVQVLVKLFDTSAKKNERIQQETEYYNTLVEVYDKLIDRQKGLTESLSGKDAAAAYKEGMGMIAAQQKAAQQSLKTYFSGGASAGSHSYGYRYNRDFGKILSQEQLFAMDAEQWTKWMTVNTDSWARLPQSVRDYAQAVMDSDEAAKELSQTMQETMVGFSVDEALDGIMELVGQSDLAFGDIANSFQEHMQQAILRVVQTKIIGEGLESWYANFVKDMEDGILSESEAQARQAEYTALIEKGHAAYLSAAEAAGINLSAAAEAAPRTSASQGVAQASQQSIDALSGVFTNIQNNVFGIHEIMRTNQEIQQANTDAALGHLSAIHLNTNRLETIENHLFGMRGSMENMADSMNAFTRG